MVRQSDVPVEGSEEDNDERGSEHLVRILQHGSGSSGHMMMGRL